MISTLKNIVKDFFLKRKFPLAVIYKNTIVDSTSKLGKYSVVFSNTILINSSLSDYSYVQKNSELINTKIGKFCSIANNVRIGLPDHPLNLLSTSPIFYDNKQPLPFSFVETQKKNITLQTVIGDDVWIGNAAMIMAGVKVGVGAVIGAGSIVTRDVLPYSIVAGSPAKHIRYRFDKELREALLASAWWELKDENLMKLKKYFNEPNEFLRRLGKER